MVITGWVGKKEGVWEEKKEEGEREETRRKGGAG